jgi:hypothetical protein
LILETIGIVSFFMSSSIFCKGWKTFFGVFFVDIVGDDDNMDQKNVTTIYMEVTIFKDSS